MVADRDRQRFKLALSSPCPSAALHELAKALKAEGMGQVAMYHLFEEFQRTLDPDDPRSDAILDNMDLIWGGGWAKGHALFEKELTSADIAELRAAGREGDTALPGS
jgi:hypothetical protein